MKKKKWALLIHASSKLNCKNDFKWKETTKKTKASYFLNKIEESQQKTVPAVDLMQIALCWLNSIRIVEKRVLGFPCNFGVMFTHAYSANNNNKSNIYLYTIHKYNNKKAQYVSFIQSYSYSVQLC
jgi:hypothetical protein